MKRHLAGYVLAFVMMGALGALAVTGDQPPEDAHCVEVEELGVWVCGTTTTVPETSSTTTTTSTSTTTTTVAATTTTVPDTLIIPETQPYPETGIKAGEGFFFIVSCTEKFGDDCQGVGKITSEIPYLGHGMPYLYSEAVEGNHDHAWWVAGDREGYRCAYSFMYDKHPNPFGGDVTHDGHFIARATVVKPGGQAYGKINDRYMDEGVRYYDGTLYLGGTNEIPDEDCWETAIDDFDYANYVPHGPDQIRVGLFRADGEISDIRDFTDYDLLAPAHFEFLSFDGRRVAIVLVLEEFGAAGQVSHVFYYDVMGDGRIAVEVNGLLIGGS
jgi:hypothetical protein